MNRYLRLCLVSCLLVTAACGGKNNENNTSTNNMTSTNGTNNTTNTNNMTTTTGPTNNTTPSGQCDAAGDTCDPAGSVNAGFACILDDDGVDGTCRPSCDANGDGSECRAGSLCGTISDGGPAFCIPSDCNGWLDDSCGAGLQCVAFVNDTDLCTQVGTLADGDACEATNADPFPCAAGLFCGFGECTPICGADTDCDSGERCIQDTLDSGVGICAVGCDSYSFGQCPAGEGCFPVTETDGICDAVGTNANYSPCTAPDDCGEGTACITFQSADTLSGTNQVARCLPFCNPIPETAPERNATCPQPGNATGYGRFVHLAEGAGDVDIYVDGALTVDNLAFEAVSSAGAFLPLSVGAHTVDITAFDAADNTSPILTLSPMVTAATVVTWGVVPDATTTIAVITVPEPRGEAAPAAGNTKLRPVHAIPDFGNVDVVAVAAGAADFTAETVLALNLASGSAAAAYTSVPAGSYDIYLFPAGAARDTANANGVTVAGVAIAADLTASVYARGTADDTDAADPGLTTIAYRSAPAQAGGLGGWCLDLGEEPSANSGFCLEDCASSDTFGTDACSTAGDQCTPLSGGFNGCFPGGPNGPGDACDPDDLEDGCDGVSWCLAYGDGTGVCQSYCQPDTQSNPLLSCSNGDECNDFGNNLGRCRTTCTPGTTFADTTSCPASLQSCVPADRGEPSYCAASGAKAIGAACAAFSGECLAGDECINDWAIDQGSDDPFADGVCADQCDPFGDGSDCGNGNVCAFNFLTLNRAVGHCIAASETLAPNAACAAGSRICGQASVCLDVGGATNQCIRFCDLDDSTTCPTGACSQLFNSTEIRVGFCQ